MVLKSVRDEFRREVKRLNAKGKNDHEIAAALNTSVNTVCRTRNELGLPPVKRYKTYAIYSGDELVDIGTADELTKKHGYRGNYVYRLASRTNTGKCKKKIAIIVEDDEDEE